MKPEEMVVMMIRGAIVGLSTVANYVNRRMLFIAEEQE
jgi:hypothetical protein